MTPAEQVEIWANAYYNGTPMVDDATYDAFCKANNLEAGLQGDELKGNREPKYKHDLTTGTLAKAEDLEDERFDRWQNWQQRPHYQIIHRMRGLPVRAGTGRFPTSRPQTAK